MAPLQSLEPQGVSLHLCAMREILLFGISGLAGLFIFGYSVHMFVGGLVSERTEFWLITIVVLIAAAVMGYFFWDILRRQGRS